MVYEKRAREDRIRCGGDLVIYLRQSPRHQRRGEARTETFAGAKFGEGTKAAPIPAVQRACSAVVHQVWLYDVVRTGTVTRKRRGLILFRSLTVGQVERAKWPLP